MSKIVPKEYYLSDDVVALSKDLLGKVLVTKFKDGKTSGVIVETEAYRGPEDRASHSYGNKRTTRTEVMFQEGGRCYVYLCYGMHHLFNIVTNAEDIPHAILVRAIVPLEGIDLMVKRRKKTSLAKGFTNGPGVVSQALGITSSHSGQLLYPKHGTEAPTIWIEDRGIEIPKEFIEENPRIGVNYAGDDALLPWRFTINNFNEFN